MTHTAHTQPAPTTAQPEQAFIERIRGAWQEYLEMLDSEDFRLDRLAAFIGEQATTIQRLEARVKELETENRLLRQHIMAMDLEMLEMEEGNEDE